jgi:7-cyano-7-deazaguanine synthase
VERSEKRVTANRFFWFFTPLHSLLFYARRPVLPVAFAAGDRRLGMECVMSENTLRKAVVLVSGGMDSAVTIALAREQGYQVHALSVAYGQRHNSELAAAGRVSRTLGAVEHKTVSVDLRSIGGSALTADIDVPVDTADSSDIPVTYVPARNTIMLSIALGWAEVLGSSDLWCGVNAVDYSGYPDCRPAFIEAFEALANVATKAGVEGAGIRVHAPLMRMSKADIAREGQRLGVDFSITVSCYQADGEGRACGHCDACRLRAQGFRDAGITDPTRYA